MQQLDIQACIAAYWRTQGVPPPRWLKPGRLRRFRRLRGELDALMRHPGLGRNWQVDRRFLAKGAELAVMSVRDWPGR